MQQNQRKHLKLSNLTQALENIWMMCCHSTVFILGTTCIALPMSQLHAETQTQASIEQNSLNSPLSTRSEKVETDSEAPLLSNESAEPMSSISVSALEQSYLNELEKVFAEQSEYDLSDEQLTEVNVQELQEVTSLAQEAQTAAKTMEMNSDLGLEQQDFLAIESLVSETQMRQDSEQYQAEVGNLITSLEQDAVNIPTFDGDQTTGTLQAQNLEDEPDEIKKTWLDRLLRRDPVYQAQVGKKSPSINVVVCGGNDDIANNIKAKLSGFTVDAFQNFERNNTQQAINPILDTKVANVAKGLFAEATCGQTIPPQNLNRGPAFSQISKMVQQAAEAVGYYEAAFNYQKVDANTLMVWVTPNTPVRVQSQKISFVESDEQGNDIEPSPEQRTRILGFRAIQQVPDLNVDDVLNHQKYETTKNRIVTAANNFGYFDAHWRIHDVRVDLPANTADIQLKYATRQRYKFEEIDFRVVGERKELPLRKEVLENLASYYGLDGEYKTSWDDTDYTNWRITTLSNNLTNSRYFNYALVNVVKPDPQPAQLEYPPERVEAQQNQDTVQPQVRAQDVITDPALQKAVDAEAQTIPEQVKAEQDETATLKEQAYRTKKVPVIVYLNADNPNNVETGIGYGTDTGVRLRTQYRRAIVNDRGHSFDANIELSEVRQAFDARYMIPVKNKNPLQDYYNLIGGYEREVRDRIGQGVELEIESAIFGAERIIKRRLTDWQHNFSLRYRLDRIDTKGLVDSNDLPDAFRIITDSPEQQSLLVGYEASKLSQNTPVNPTQGFRQFYRIDVGSESLLTETDLAIFNAGWRFLYSFGGEGVDHQIVGRTDLGYIVTDNFDDVPYNLRYFAGGDQSIRGFDYKSLSPKQDKLLIGGQALATGSLEYNYQFKEGWRAAIFTDVGNAYNEEFSNDTKYGAGLGIRWASPVGPIRIDVAAGVSEQSIPIRLHFFIGPAL